jgi:3-methyladenine DNA glycosylase AlkD
MSKIFPINPPAPSSQEEEEEKNSSNLESGQTSEQEQFSEAAEEIRSNSSESKKDITTGEAAAIALFAVSLVAWLVTLALYPNQLIPLVATSSIPIASAYFSRRAFVILLHSADEQEFESEYSYESSRTTEIESARTSEIELKNLPLENYPEKAKSLLETASKNLTKTILAQNSLKIAEELIGQDFSFYRSSAAAFIQNIPLEASCEDLLTIVNAYSRNPDLVDYLDDNQKENIRAFQEADKTFLATKPEIRGFFIAAIAASLKHKEAMLENKYPDEAFAKAISLSETTIDNFVKVVEVELLKIYQDPTSSIEELGRDKKTEILCAFSLMRDGNINAIASQIKNDVPSTSVILSNENAANHNLRGAAASEGFSL